MEQSRTVLGRGSFPVELTHFIGRDTELAALRALVRSTRLLTLTGAGGSGKSRLALELAPDLAAVAADGVAWVELAPLGDASLIAAEVLRALGSPSEGGAASAASVAAVLRDRSVVLVLDNCEHLVDGCAGMADALLRSCAGLRIIATSREALGVAGERAWLVPPMAVPAPDADLSVLESADAVRLFVDRARDVLPDFSLTPQNAPAVASICARLDGIPLAIELAAARVRLMTPEQILERLSDAFALLKSGSRTALPRHRTLRATLDWSHDLLPDDARTVLHRLCVFRGGFTLDAAEVVVAGAGIDGAEVLDLLATLADRSLVVVREHHATARYQLLETVRQYAEQKLRAAGDLERVRAAHAASVLDLVTEVAPAFITTARRAAFSRLEPELDNIREALHWTHANEPAQHVGLVGLLWWFWFSTRHWVEAHRWLAGALELPAAAQPSLERAALLFAYGALASLRGQVPTAEPALQEAAALAGRLGDERLEAYALNYLGMAYGQEARVEAREYSGRAEKWFRAHNDLYGLRLALLLMGIAERAAGNAAAAMEMTREAVGIARRFGKDRELAIALQNLAYMLVGDEDYAAARDVVIESLQALHRDPSYLFIYRGIDYLALINADTNPRLAAELFGAADSVRTHIGAIRFRMDEQRLEAAAERARAALGADWAPLFEAARRIPATEVLDFVFARIERPAAAAGTVSTVDTADAPRTGEAAFAAGAAAAVEQAAAAADAAPGGTAADVAVDLAVTALGPFEVAVRGRRIEAWPYTKPKELLLYLVCHPQGRSRIEIGQAIWPDAAPSQVRNSFHVTLHHVRKTIGEADWIVLEGERYRIARDLTIDFDVTRFEEEVKRGLAADAPPNLAVATLRRAVATYRGHFFGAEAAAPWRDEVQDRLRRLFCDAGVRLGELLAGAGDAEGAAAAYEAVVASEPLHEEAHRGLLLAWTYAGKRAHALRHYERLTTLLRTELDMEPEPETAELFDRIRSADIVPR